MSKFYALALAAAVIDGDTAKLAALAREAAEWGITREVAAWGDWARAAVEEMRRGA